MIALLTPPVIVGIVSIVVAISLAILGWIVLHHSAEARELRKEQRARQHAHKIARKRLRGRLDNHIEQIVEHLQDNQTFVIDIWQRNHDLLMQCAGEPNVIDFLGNRYDDFKAVLNREQMQIDRVVQNEREYSAPAVRSALADAIELYLPYLTWVEGSRMAAKMPQFIDRIRAENDPSDQPTRP